MFRSSSSSEDSMSIPHTTPPSHLPALHAIQRIILDTRPARPAHLPTTTWRKEWRAACLRRLYELAAASDDLVVVPDGLSHELVIGAVSYRLMAVRPRKAPKHVDYRARLRSNQHGWLRPAADQLDLFDEGCTPGSPAMPVPLSFDYEGTLFVGWPDFVSPKGTGWGLVDARAVAEIPLVVPDEPVAAAPEEIVPDLVVPALKKKTHE